MSAEILPFEKPKRKRSSGKKFTEAQRQKWQYENAVQIGVQTALSLYDESADLWYAINAGTKKASETILTNFYTCLEFMSYGYAQCELSARENELIKNGDNIDRVVKNYSLLLLRKLILEAVQWKLKLKNG